MNLFNGGFVAMVTVSALITSVQSSQPFNNGRDHYFFPDKEIISNENLHQQISKRSTENSGSSRTTFDKKPDHSMEYKLYNNLIGSNSRYLKHIRPVEDHRNAIIVEVGMSVMMIEELIERDQIMVMAAAIKMKWTDAFLAWEPEQYSNLTWMAVSSNAIWVPDISIVNSPEPFSMTRKVTHVDIDHNGEVGFYPSGRLMTRCNLHITYFPFDHQHCEVFLESWIHPSDYLKIVPYEKYGSTVDIKEYYTNHQWAILSYEVNLGSADYDGKNFSSITFVYMLKRKSQYYFMYYVFPQLLLAFLQTLSHTLPVEHPGRMAMLTSLFIGTSVTQAGVAVHIPKSSESMSLLQIYMTMMSCNLVVALIVTFVMMYSVLRYPNKEPSIQAMFVAFFSIVWPTKPKDDDHSDGYSSGADDTSEFKLLNDDLYCSNYYHQAGGSYLSVNHQSKKESRRKLNKEISNVSGHNSKPNTPFAHMAKVNNSDRRNKKIGSPKVCTSPLDSCIENFNACQHRQLFGSGITAVGHYIPPELNGIHCRNGKCLGCTGDASLKKCDGEERSHLLPPDQDLPTPSSPSQCDRNLSPASAVPPQSLLPYKTEFVANTQALDHFASPCEKYHCCGLCSDKFNKPLSWGDSETKDCDLSDLENDVERTSAAQLPRLLHHPKSSLIPKKEAILLFDNSGYEFSSVAGNNMTSSCRPDYGQEKPSLHAKLANVDPQSDSVFPEAISNISKKDSTKLRNQPSLNSQLRNRFSSPQQTNKASDKSRSSKIIDAKGLKRRWLIYCVALDKTIMYANLAWNLAAFVCLFIIIPYYAPQPVYVGHDD